MPYAVNSQLRQFKACVDAFHSDVGRYPTNSEGLYVLVAPPRGLESKWQGPYVAQVAKDPWGHPYIYGTSSDPTHPFSITCKGGDGVTYDSNHQ